jgi:hypothetical protein
MDDGEGTGERREGERGRPGDTERKLQMLTAGARPRDKSQPLTLDDSPPASHGLSSPPSISRAGVYVEGGIVFF